MLPGESFSFSVGYRFLVGGVDPLALTDMMAVGEATIDREGDGAPDFAIIAKAAPTLLAEDGGIDLVERLLEVQLDTQVAAAIAPTVGEAPTPAEPTEDRIIITTTDQDVSASLSTSGFMPATDGEVLITETIEAENSADATLAAIEEALLATDPIVSGEAEAAAAVMPNDAMVDDIMIDDVMIDDVMSAGTGLDGGFDNSGFADFNDPVQQFQQEQMSYEQAGGQPAPTLYQSAPVQQQRFVRPPKLVRKLIPGPKIAFPAGSVPVTLTTGFQLAVPEGFQAYQAPDGSFFLMRKQ